MLFNSIEIVALLSLFCILSKCVSVRKRFMPTPEEKGLSNDIPSGRHDTDLYHMITTDIRASITPVVLKFFTACKQGDYETVLQLIQRGLVNVNQIDENYSTGICYATLNGHIEIVRFLLIYGAEINRHDRSGTYPLHFAVQSGNLELVQLLVYSGADIDITQTKYEETPLHWAISLRHARIVNFLISAKANLHIRNRGGITPYLLASHLGYFNIYGRWIPRLE